MRARTKVAVIGGGIAGCSTLYHLKQEGINDVVLLERNQLTSGTTWHSAAASEYHDLDWLEAHITSDMDVKINSLTDDHTILLLAGPKSCDVLSAVSRLDWSKQAFPWLSVRECFIGIAPAVVMAVSFSGELAYEIHVTNALLYAACLAIEKAGAEHDLRLFGARDREYAS